MFPGVNLKIFPMYCLMGSAASRTYYGDKLARYFDNDDYFFVVSSELSHFGPLYRNNDRIDKNYNNIND